MANVHDAAKRNDVEELGRLLDGNPGLIEAADPFTPLCYACVAGAVDAARLLLDRGADLHRRDGGGRTALMRACHAGRVDVVALLLSRGADPSATATDGASALTEAALGGERPCSDHVAVMRLLLKDGRVAADARGVRGGTALWWTCRYGHSERARVLLVEGLADHMAPNDQGDTPVAVAQRRWRDDCIRLFEWYEGELEKAFLLTKARAVVDAAESISKAPEKVGAKTEAEAQRAREEAAPAYLRGRVVRGEALPVVEVVGQAGHWEEQQQEKEPEAVCEWLVRELAEDLYMEVMEGLRYR